MQERFYKGAIQGAVFATVYAIVEVLFSTILSWIIKPDYDYLPTHWGFITLKVLIIYPMIGLITGGLLAVVLYIAVKRFHCLQEVQFRSLFQSVLILIIIVIFSINLVIQLLPNYAVILFTLSVYLLYSAILIFNTRPVVKYKKIQFITNIWTASFILLGLPWIIKELLQNYSIGVKVLAVSLYIITLTFIAFFIQTSGSFGKDSFDGRISNDPETASVFSIKYLKFILTVICIVIGINFFLVQKTPESAQNSGLPQQYAIANHNVILIIMDTVRADHLSLYGYERDTTPNLRRFSEEATLYTHAISPGNHTLPTHASIFTGLYARKHEAHYAPPDYPVGRPLNEKYHTLAEILSEKGYSTMAVISNYAYLSPYFQLDQGFKYFDQRRQIPFLGEMQSYYLSENILKVLKHFTSPSLYSQKRDAKDINNEVFSLLDKEKAGDGPFFLFVNYMDAHWPYIPPPPFDSLYPGKKGIFTQDRFDQMREEVMKKNRKITKEEYHYLVSQYDGGIAYLDFHIGSLMDKLKELDMYKNTLIIITSDHGEAFGEKDIIEHGHSTYQNMVHVPLIIKYPETDTGPVVDEIVSSIDLMPTILDVLGYEVPGDIQGISLLENKSQKSGDNISEAYHSNKFRSRFGDSERAIFSWPFKFIGSVAGKEELYNLSEDPNEEKNLFKPDDSVSNKLQISLNKWLETVVPESGSSDKLDKEALDRLKSLGYIQ